MTNEKHDPWALLREATSYLDDVVRAAPEKWKWTDEQREAHDLRDRIDAALAAHEAEEKVEVEWWTPSSHRAKEGKYEMHVWRMSLKQWGWSTYAYQEREVGSGLCNTLDEAKSAAVAAARGLK